MCCAKAYSHIPHVGYKKSRSWGVPAQPSICTASTVLMSPASYLIQASLRCHRLDRSGESLSTQHKQTLSNPCVTIVHANQAYQPIWEGAQRSAQHPCRLALTSTRKGIRRVRVKPKFRHTKTTSASFGKVLAIWAAPQTACADSRARRESVDQLIDEIGVHTWDNALKLGAHSESAESFFICSGNIFCPPRVFQPGMFRSYARVVETSTDRMSFVDLPTWRL